jgi:hypothetical protein
MRLKFCLFLRTLRSHLGQLGRGGIHQLGVLSDSRFVTLDGSQSILSPISADALTNVGAGFVSCNAFPLKIKM